MRRIHLVVAVAAMTAVFLCGPTFASSTNCTTVQSYDGHVVDTALAPDPFVAALKELQKAMADQPRLQFGRVARDERTYFFAARMWDGKKPQYHMLN